MSSPPGKRKHTARGVLSDLNFLGLSHLTGKARDFSIERSQFDVVICGWDDTKWTAYAFGNRAQTEDDVSDEEGEDEEEEEEVGEEEGDNIEIEEHKQQEQNGPEAPIEDPIATDHRRVIPADPPVADPRLYFLIIVESVMPKVAQAGHVLIFRIEESIEEAVCDFQFTNCCLLDYIPQELTLLLEVQTNLCSRVDDRCNEAVE